MEQLAIEIFERLESLTSVSYEFSGEFIDHAFCVFQTPIGPVDIYKFQAKEIRGGWSYQVGQDLFERTNGKTLAEIPVRSGYKYDLTCPELVQLSAVEKVYELNELLQALECGSNISKQIEWERTT